MCSRHAHVSEQALDVLEVKEEAQEGSVAFNLLDFAFYFDHKLHGDIL